VTGRWVYLLVVLAWGCGSKDPLGPPAGGDLASGTWGGDNAGVIVSDSGTHVHIGCTYGDVTGLVPLDSSGRFSVSGSYVLRAYPVAVGPSLPAQFSGSVAAGTLTLTVTVTDTVMHATTVLGPATVVLGKEPVMGVCPICRTPADRKARANGAARRAALLRKEAAPPPKERTAPA